MTTINPAPAVDFQWTPQPAAAALIEELVSEFTARCPAACDFAARLRRETGTRLMDWIDSLHLPASAGMQQRLRALGFTSMKVAAGNGRWSFPQGLFPTVVLAAGDVRRLAIKVESVADFLFAQRLDDRTSIQCAVGGPMRFARVWTGDAAEFWAVERHGAAGYWGGDLGFEVDGKVATGPHPALSQRERSSDGGAALQDTTSAGHLLAAARHAEAFERRRRDFATEQQGFDHASALIRAAAIDLGTDWACALFFAAERKYWQSRNRAARLQKARQDALGLGWANHDHHTYRSSRANFTRLIAVLEQLGFECRERFYGGHGAGWGAQVLEQPAAGIVIFADVDLTPEEVTGDFAHEPLPPQAELGTVGLWCALHGEAFLQAGMHHLECQFDFDAARGQLAELGVPTMKPFTDFPFLKQCFTEGETWSVDPARIDVALAAGAVTAEQAARFRVAGALGSHLEILQRDDGYKGFNQTGISEIIRGTDPRGH